MRPNILYVHSHDTGRYVQPYGHQVPTPNIQHLADQGVLFRQAFCAAPTCSGSRATLLTGQYCHQNGMLGLAHRGWALNDYGQHIVHPLRDAGYSSVLIGEQHISEDPEVIGYDEVLEVASHRANDVAPMTEEALATLEEPFFASVGFFETHRQFSAPTSVRDTLYSLPPANLPDAPATREDMAAFKASARSLDQGIGAVLNALHKLGLAERTLILCTTDHGLAFPNAKGTLYDRGIGVMLIMRGPAGFTGGRVVDSLVSHVDLYPTLCDLAGAERPSSLAGESLLPLVAGEVDRVRDEVYAELTYHAAYSPMRAIRTDRWKYIRRFDDYPHPVLANCDDSASKQLLADAGWAETEIAEEQLFDLTLDPNELKDLSSVPRHDATLAELRGRLEEWMRETADPLLDGPVPLPPGAWANAPDQVSPNDPATVMDTGEMKIEDPSPARTEVR
jgi:N-sulfoglucosamine sulfohydrolase